MPEFVGTVAVTADTGWIRNSTSTFESGVIVQLNSNANANDRCRGWVRIPDVTVPNGDTIDTAILNVRSSGDVNNDANVTIRGVLGANVSSPADAAAFDAFTLTTASVSWIQDGLAFNPTRVDSPSVASIVDEITSQGTWESGHALMFAILGNDDSFKRFNFSGFSSDHGPILTVNHSAASGGSSIPAIIHDPITIGI